MSRKSRSREPDLRHRGFFDKEPRSQKPSARNHSSRQAAAARSKPSKSERVETLRGGKEPRTVEVSSSRMRDHQKGTHTKSADVGQKLLGSENVGFKQTESVLSSTECPQSANTASVEGKTGKGVEKLMELNPVPQKKVVSLMGMKLPRKHQQPAEKVSRPKQVSLERVAEAEAVVPDQMHTDANAEQRSRHMEDADFVPAKEAEATAPPTLPDRGSAERDNDAVESSVADTSASPAPEPVIEKPSTTETELAPPGDEPAVLPPAADKLPETGSSVRLERMTVPPAIAEKTEVAVRNVAEVKPLLVASVPEMSRWERELDIPERHELPVHSIRDRDRDRSSAVTTSLPR